MFKVKVGDILESPNKYIMCHFVNCMGLATGGVAKDIFNTYQATGKQYRHLCINTRNPQDLLGYVYICEDIEDRLIINIFSQKKFRKNILDRKVYTDYSAIEKALKELRDHKIPIIQDKLNKEKLTFVFPWNVGCDRGGGNFVRVYKLIRKYLKHHNVIFYCKNSYHLPASNREYPNLIIQE